MWIWYDFCIFEAKDFQIYPNIHYHLGKMMGELATEFQLLEFEIEVLANKYVGLSVTMTTNQQSN